MTSLPVTISQDMSFDHSGYRCSSPLYADFQRYLVDGSFYCSTYAFRQTDLEFKEFEDFEKILPIGFEILRRHRGNAGRTMLAKEMNGRSVLLLSTQVKKHVEAEIAADTIKHAQEVADKVTAMVPAIVDPNDGTVYTRVWYMGADGPDCTAKRIGTHSWADIEQNYPPSVRTELEKMMGWENPTAPGKLILWHGPPGTGKTTALRSLGWAWKKWCTFHYVSDSEEFFRRPTYLMNVGSHNDTDDEDRPMWRLVVVEDADDFLRVDAKRAAGAALGRLLNFGDGILGQGSDTIILLTTNEAVNQLHEAVVRPGRCLAQLEFPRFTHTQAIEWLGGEAPGLHGQATLAELIDRKSRNADHQLATGIQTESSGQYL